ncbi:Coenzyme Q-binding protein COQ10 [Theobroma cacao]|nr:Coenzyme Q-binding protein COQ10 [Theobroma cacao]
MSSAAISFISSPNSPRLSHVSPTNRNAILLTATPSCRISSLKPPPLSSIFIRIPYGSFKKSSFFTSSRTFSPVMEWQDCTVKTEIDVPASMAYKCYSDREAIPNWMPFISSVKILEDKPNLSRWSLKYNAFGRDIEYSWLARNMQRCCSILSKRSLIMCSGISYEVPQLLAPVASALQPFLENLLKRGLDRFENFAKSSGSTR